MSPAMAPIPRVAVVALAEQHFASTVALAVTVVQRAAEAGGLPGSIVTVDERRVALAVPRRRRGAIALRGFEPVGRAGRVTMLAAGDVEAASIAASGVVPIACVLSAGEGLAGELARICPGSLLLVADDSISDNYLELLAGDLGGSVAVAKPRVLRYREAVDEAARDLSLVVDSSAALRLRLGMAPGPRSRANAEAAVALLGSA